MCFDGMRCAVPFLDESRSFVLGVEMGMLFKRMDDREESISGVYHRANDEQLFLMAQRMGYAVDWKPIDDTWFEAKFAMSLN